MEEPLTTEKCVDIYKLSGQCPGHFGCTTKSAKVCISCTESGKCVLPTLHKKNSTIAKTVTTKTGSKKNSTSSSHNRTHVPAVIEPTSDIMIQEMKVAADIKDAHDETKIAIANKEKARTPKEKDALQIAVKSMKKLVPKQK